MKKQPSQEQNYSFSIGEANLPRKLACTSSNPIASLFENSLNKLTQALLGAIEDPGVALFPNHPRH